MQKGSGKLNSTLNLNTLLRTNRTNWNSTLWTARALNDPYESNELNFPLADRYSVGVLDMCTFWVISQLICDQILAID